MTPFSEKRTLPKFSAYPPIYKRRFPPYLGDHAPGDDARSTRNSKVGEEGNIVSVENSEPNDMDCETTKPMLSTANVGKPLWQWVTVDNDIEVLVETPDQPKPINVPESIITKVEPITRLDNHAPRVNPRSTGNSKVDEEGDIAEVKKSEKLEPNGSECETTKPMSSNAKVEEALWQWVTLDNDIELLVKTPDQPKRTNIPENIIEAVPISTLDIPTFLSHTLLRGFKHSSTKIPKGVTIHRDFPLCRGRRSYTLESDISQGKEEKPVRVINFVDDEKLPPFHYITNVIYPEWYESIHSIPTACDCINGCVDFEECQCTVRYGGDIPFTLEGAIVRPRHLIYECGPSCKCPPSCQNRVSQNGIRYSLEIFKTEKMGWGVRSRDFIQSGGFVCEYTGVLLREQEAEERVGNDEYLFDIGKNGDVFTIDAAKFGNVGRFINHSCSPNLYAQNVLYDHDDKRVPHIMFFATKNIPPLRELTYDYNYKLDRVRDASGNIKRKDCYCGSRVCRGRLY